MVKRVWRQVDGEVEQFFSGDRHFFDGGHHRI